MIFVTVGTQLTFDRLIRAVDAWAEANPGQEVFAQINEGGYQPRHIAFAAHVDPLTFSRRFAEATVVVAHAGMGTIIPALEAGKPLLLLPRLAALGEHRNDHQVGTARFGTDPKTSVLDTNCKAHELDNLYVVDGSFFPSSAAVNPSLTIMANALRVGDHLAERLK